MLLLSAVSTAGAAGLGTLAVQSALGEPFRAEIDLLSYQDGSAAPVVRLANPELYRLVDFRYNAALSGAQLNLRRHANGRNYVEIVSERRVYEPFVYLLVELEHGGTRVLRGYTALLNPWSYGPPVADYAPVVIPAAVPAPLPAVTPPAAAPGVKAAVAAAPAVSAVAAKQLSQLEAQLSANTQTLAGMLERVAAMEQMVQRLQAALDKPAPAPPQPKPAPPPVAKAPPPPADLPPRRERSWTESILNEALLILAGGALLLVLGLGYWMWGRGPAKGAV